MRITKTILNEPVLLIAPITSHSVNVRQSQGAVEVHAIEMSWNWKEIEQELELK